MFELLIFTYYVSSCGSHEVLLPASGATTVQGCLPLADKTIVLDPGHGGYDQALWLIMWKKKVVLEIALLLRDYLQASGHGW